MNALWAADVLGRLAYNGLDFITWYEGYGVQGYATIYPDQNDTFAQPNKVMLRPSYYPFFMYAQYFGDMMVESSSSDEALLSIWASTDSDDPGKLKLMVTNISSQSYTAPITLTGASASSGQAYVLKSTSPTSMSSSSNLASAPTTINGVKLDGMNVLGSAAAIQPIALNVTGSSFQYTFEPYTVTAIVLQTGPSSTTTFSDVPVTHPYYTEIEALYDAGYTAGCAEAPLRYCPEQQMNRAESAVFVVRGVHGASTDPSDPPSSPFADLTTSDWALNWANQLYVDGFTAGCGTNPLVYCPWAGHTRAEGAVFYLRMLNGADYEPPAASGTFSDVATNLWYAKWVEAAYDAGILPACGENPLQACPEAALDRGLAAYMLYQAKELGP
jgi:hypothetical protein